MLSLTPSWLVLLCWVLSILCFKALSDESEISVKFLKAPHAFSHLNTATFAFQALVGGKVSTCSNCSISCKLDGGATSNCGGGKVLYQGLQDGNHAFEVCVNRSQRVGCGAYNWTVDTLPPKASVVASTSFTNALNVSVNITFTEPCTGGGGFGCSSVNACNLLVYGSGEVIPSSFTTLRPNLKYSLMRAKQLLTQVGATFKVIELDEEKDGYEIQAALGQWTGLRTVPNIFIGGKHIGGCDNLLHKYQSGELLGLLTEAGATPDATKPHQAQADPNTNNAGHAGRIIDA